MANAITDPRLEIDGVAWQVVPNTFWYKRGRGEVKVKAASLGANVVVPIFENDKTSAVGEFQFQIFPTAESIALLQSSQDGGNTHVASFTDNENFIKTANNIAVATTDPEIKLGSDQTIEVICMGGNVV